MSVSDETTTVSDGILLSDAAAAKVKGLLEQEGREDLALRVAVQPGGCSGLRYQLERPLAIPCGGGLPDLSA